MTFGIINLWSAGVMALLLLPNLVYALKFQDANFRSGSRWLNLLEQAGRYGSMALSVIPLGAPGGKFGFASVGEMLAWMGLMAAILAAYYLCWLLYARRRTPALAMALAVLPCVLFLVHALLLRHWLLGLFTAVFAAAHLTIVRQNTRS